MNNTVKKLSLLLFCSLLMFPLFAKELNEHKVNLEFNNVEISKVFSSITEQTGIGFSYLDKDLNPKTKVTIKSNSETLDVIIKRLLGDKAVTWSLSENTLLIKKRVVSKASKIAISGTVTDTEGAPLPGVTVLELGSQNGAITDVEGKFSLNVHADGTLEFSYIGMATKKVPVEGNRNFDVQLGEDRVGMDEVVVVGYGVQKKVNISGAVESISMKEMESQPVTDITKGLQGVAAGLNINVSNGRASEVADINIRGFESINGGEPLIIIDGMSSTSRELANLNPIDIKSISVLKDAASAAIYGARAAFGVVVVETKTGDGKMKVSYNSTFSFKAPTNGPEMVSDLEDFYSAKFYAAYPLYGDVGLASAEYAKNMKKDPEKYPATRVDENGNWQYFHNTNWAKAILKDYNLSQAHNVSIAGMSKETGLNYYLSAAYNQDGGMLRVGSDTFDKYNLRSNLSIKIFDFLKIGNNTSIAHTEYSEPVGLDFRALIRTGPEQPIYNPDGSYTSTGASLVGVFENGGRSEEKKTFFQNNIYADLEFFDGVWKIHGDLALKRFFYTDEEYNVPVPYRSGPDKPLSYTSPTTYAERGSKNTTYTGINLYSTIAKTFDVHDINLLIGYNQEENKYWDREFKRNDLISNSLPSAALATGDPTIDEDYEDWAVRGAFARLNYIFDEKYILEFNTRYDGTSKFPSGDRFAIYPSFSSAWRVSEEDFFPKNPYVSSAKLKYSWGELGNQSVGPYDYMSTMTPGQTSEIVNGKKPLGVSAPGLVANSLTWERVESTNFGVELGFFDNRFSVEMDVFERYTKDMLTKSKTLPSVLGTSEPKENAADLKNRGWDLTLKWQDTYANVLGSDLKLRVRFNISDSRAWITAFDNPDNYLGDDDADEYYVGKEIGEIWGLTNDGLFQSAPEIKNHAYQDHLASDEVGRFHVGDVKWKDLDGDGKITRGTWRYDNSGDFRVIGNSTERYRYGINLDVSWHNFDLSVFAQGVGKKDWTPGNGNLYFWSILAQPWTSTQSSVYYNSWTPERTDAYFPRIKAYAAEDSDTELGLAQTRYLIDASYLRIKNISLAYNIPKSITAKLGIQNLRIIASGQNLFTYSDLLDFDIDPEVTNGAGDYPLAKSYTLGLSLKF